MFCRKCGAAAEQGAAFCLKCGSPVVKSARPAQPTYRDGNKRKNAMRWLLTFIAISIAATAFVFHSFLPPAADAIGQWIGPIAFPSGDAFAEAPVITLNVSSLDWDGSVSGTITLGDASAPLSGHVYGQHAFLSSTISSAESNEIIHLTVDGTFDQGVLKAQVSASTNSSQLAAAIVSVAVSFTRQSPQGGPALPAPTPSALSAQAAPPTVASASPAIPATDEPPASVPNSTVTSNATAEQAQQPVDVVRDFYSLWNQHQLVDAYQLLSDRYRASHPFSAWEKTHDTVLSIGVTASTTPDPMNISVDVQSVDRTGTGNANSEYRGTWTVVIERGQPRLDSVSLQQIR